MKKLNNKGFSLVELIIVIAIMAVLAGALAPALITYIEKSRISTDKSTADTIRSAVQSALADDTVYDAVVPSTGNYTAKYVPGTGLSTSDALKTQLDNTLDKDDVKIKSKKAWDTPANGYHVAISDKGTVRVYLIYGANAAKYGATTGWCSDSMKADPVGGSSSSSGSTT